MKSVKIRTFLLLQKMENFSYSLVFILILFHIKRHNSWSPVRWDSVELFSPDQYLIIPCGQIHPLQVTLPTNLGTVNSTSGPNPVLKPCVSSKGSAVAGVFLIFNISFWGMQWREQDNHRKHRNCAQKGPSDSITGSTVQSQKLQQIPGELSL